MFHFQAFKESRAKEQLRKDKRERKQEIDVRNREEIQYIREQETISKTVYWAVKINDTE